MAEQQIQVPSGIVAMTTHGFVRGETVQCFMDMRSHCDKNGLHNIQWTMVPGALPEKTRNEAARHLLKTPGADWLVQIDADMTFGADALLRMLQIAYGELPHADVVGAYCTLRGEPALPTIDTGTGTWQSIFPGSGTLEVMRTGAAFFLTKRRVFENLNEPWFRMRVPARPIDFMAEVDNWARIKFDGKNPFRNTPEQYWEKLEKCALEDPSSAPGVFVPAEVGEDSGFFDRCRNAGFRLFVATDIVTGHLDTVTRSWNDHKKWVARGEEERRLASGLLK